MAAKTRKVKLEKFIEQTIAKIMQTGVVVGLEKAKEEVKYIFKQTELRLYAYPELKKNIEKYLADIEDLRCEKPGRSKDIVFYSTSGSGSRLTDDEIQEARIMVLRNKIHRDQSEIDEVDFALEAVVNEEYYKIITMKYFEGKNDEEIAEEIACDPRTIRRNKNRIINKIAVKLYGAKAVS